MAITRWEQGRADIDRLLTQGRLERVTPNQKHAQVLTAILINQGLRPNSGEGGHAVLREALLAQLEPPNQPAVRAFGWMRQTRNISSYPVPDGATATEREVTDGIEAARAMIEVATKVIPVMPVYGR